ncbi:hypothetical protein DYH10_03815 [Candidatus Saccharibacteria bacterium CPR2]|nr:hypothetical protein [Candidatus Saccharibacteria bacterium CPR2]
MRKATSRKNKKFLANIKNKVLKVRIMRSFSPMQLAIIMLITGVVGYLVIRSFAATGLVSSLKPPIQGVATRSGPPTSHTSFINSYVVNINWSDLQPASASGFVPDKIKSAIDAAKLKKATIKLRIFAGDKSPTWVKNLDGSPVTYYEPEDAKQPSYQIPRFWTPNYKRAYTDLHKKISAWFDRSPYVRDITINGCMTVYAEPLIRGASDTRNITNLHAAGFTLEKDKQCQKDQIAAHSIYKYTRSSIALNPYQAINDNNTVSMDVNFTNSLMDYCRQTLGNRCVLANNSIRDASTTSSPLGDNYTVMYSHMKSKGAPITFQTATSNKIGNWINTLNWAEATMGANMVELNSDYGTYDATTLQQFDAKFEQNTY